jgi:hypothetical protein
MNRVALVAVLALVVGISAGCSSRSGRPPTYPVTGTVTWKGKPLEAATVVYVPVTPGVEAASGITDAAGRYRLTTYVAGDGAQAGEYHVKVSKYDLKKATQEEKQKFVSIEEEQKMVFARDELPTPPAKNTLPKKYESESTSGIGHTVTKGPNTRDISLD